MEEEEIFELLGSSQTFLGTLATLAILCIFHNDNNFIYKILEAVRTDFQNEINKLRSHIRFENIMKTAEYKLLMFFINDSKSDLNKKQEGAKLLTEIASVRQQLQFKYGVPLETIGDRKFEEIKNAKEQVMAPLYTFGLCLLIFIFDELLRLPQIGCNDFLCSTLMVFISLSIFYWVWMWGKFMAVFYFSVQKDEKPKDTDEKSSTKRNMTYLSALRDFSVILGASIMICLMLFSIVVPLTNLELLPYQAHLFKISIFSAIILNGFLLPFLMPYICYRGIYRKARKKVANSQTEIAEQENRLKKQIESFCENIDFPT